MTESDVFGKQSAHDVKNLSEMDKSDVSACCKCCNEMEDGHNTNGTQIHVPRVNQNESNAQAGKEQLNYRSDHAKYCGRTKLIIRLKIINHRVSQKAFKYSNTQS